ncbi:MAG: 30S ribosomal protein S17 [Thermoplasmata archaeon M11B2D]|nr:MAG: 30S ribosomal protein S17 [Thermoplasmata archaeon M11B2D]PNX53454.1 MAG: 30S ribosomal protein S17 [Thermoplasmata archaeon M9B2D]
MAEEKHVRNIGLNVKPPSSSCTDKDCPFHGALSVRGLVLMGTVVSTKRQGTIAVQREFMHYVKKYERYEKRTSTYHAHCPPCMVLKSGDTVRIAECRPLSKTVSFVAIEKL